MPSELLERFILDARADGGTAPLEVTGGMTADPDSHGFGLMEIQFPRPEVQRNWAGSRFTEGERPADDPRFMNRKIPVKVWGFEGQGIGAASNLFPNPSFEVNGTDGVHMAGSVATNLIPNPILDSATTGWLQYGSSAISRDTGEYPTGYAAASLKVVTPATTLHGGQSHPAVAVGAAQFTGSCYFKGTAGQTFRFRLLEYAADGTTFIGETGSADFTATGSWQRISSTRTFAAGSTAKICVSHIEASVTTFYMTAGLLEQTSTLKPFFPTPNQISWGQITWTGTAHNSTSELRPVWGTTSSDANYAAAAVAGEKALMVLAPPRSGQGVNFVVGSGMPGGVTYTASATVTALSGFAGRQLDVSFYSRNAGGTLTGTSQTITVTDDPQRISLTWPFEANADRCWFIISAPSTNVAVNFFVDAVCISQRTEYFDGDTPGCSWTGTPHNSTSARRGTGSDTKRFLDCIFDLESKLEKLAREGGTARRVLPDGTPITFDILDATYPADWQRTISQGRMEFSFELTAKPFARQPPVTLATVNKPASTSVATIDTGTVPGNAPALVRLKVNDTGTAQRNHLLVGSAQAADPAMLLAKTRQLLGGALVNSPTSAATTNGGPTNGTVKMTMNAAWRPVLSTNDSAPAYQTHEGIQRVLARVFFPSSNTDDVNLKFEWAQADLARWSTSDLTDGSQYVTLTGNQQIGVWQWVDLGTINLTKPRSDVWNDSAGWRWEGRLTARANSGDIYVDALSIIPAGNFLAEMFANPQIPESNEAVIGLDNGTLPGGTLNGTAATIGGNWSEIGGVSGFERTGPGNLGTIYRSPASNDAAMKFARIGTSTQGPIYASCSFGAAASGYGGASIGGLLVRYTDANNYAVASIVTAGNGAQTLAFWVYKAGALVLNQMVALPSVSNSWGISLAINSDGSGIATANSGSTVRSVSWPANSDLATGTLSSGGFGLAHRVTAQTMSDLWGTPQFRSLTNTTIEDAVIFPSRSAILTHATALRYDSAGNSLGEIGRYQGDRLTVPAGSSSRIAILDGRVAPGSADNNLDTLSMELSLIPRVVDVPEPV